MQNKLASKALLAFLVQNAGVTVWFVLSCCAWLRNFFFRLLLPSVADWFFAVRSASAVPMPEPDNAAMLFNRLNKYGPGSKPGALVAPQRRQGVASPGGLAPLPPPPALQSPALRQSQKRGPDAALSSGSLHDATMLSASNSKGTLLAGTELLSASAPMPFSKMSRKIGRAHV